jgi:hypothetical protein
MELVAEIVWQFVTAIPQGVKPKALWHFLARLNWLRKHSGFPVIAAANVPPRLKPALILLDFCGG